MQVISRCVNEGLVIGNEITVTVLEILDDCVRLEIHSPQSSPEYREEVIYVQAAANKTLQPLLH